MPSLLRSLLLLSLLAPALRAANPPAAETLTFQVAGVECGSCVFVVQQSLSEVPSVRDVAVVQVIDSYANVTFDPQVVSAHQIAQAVYDAIPLHGQPYEPTLVVRVPDYAKPGNAAKVDAVFARWKQWVRFVPADKAKGEFVVHFEPLQADKTRKGPQGWTLQHLARALQGPAPEGLGLAFQVVRESP